MPRESQRTDSRVRHRGLAPCGGLVVRSPVADLRRVASHAQPRDSVALPLNRPVAQDTSRPDGPAHATALSATPSAAGGRR